ncbi:Rpn family recombination-promoting nuclease/putative transposase [Mediterraneibacter glycyrrhizinilyticus]|uniref:Rpn family recombination-promoting nuclease/putative transposase n=1 Tax=Mediterraneibacter glycyrrhizinilyticus TaxID=342942 RepID=UPI00189CB46B|nr:Rpn family recombination-promoting nuclease/putative transposase [Mediterraneibacter glycyrrhizinilyticus]
MGRKLRELTIKDDFMFGAVMSDPENCRELLEMILGISIDRIEVSKEKSMVYHPEYKGVRLDVYARDEENTCYNVEMQASRRPVLGKRSRYYQSQMDMEMLQSGRDYEELPKSFVVFICDFDPFGKELYRYTFKMKCEEDVNVELEDARQIIFLSTQGKNREEVPKELVTFLEYVKADLEESQKDFHNSYVRRLQDSVQRVKANREMEERFMLLEEKLKEERAEGEKIGWKLGQTQGARDMLLKMLEILGEIPEPIREKITSVSEQETLMDWAKIAVQSASMEEFVKKISE